MPNTIPVKPSDLLIDEINPRIPLPNAGQREVQRELARHQGPKLLALARDILGHGLNPADLPIVMPFEGDHSRCIVLEGNRRIVALKALENPEIFAGAVDEGVLKELRNLSKEYQKSPVEDVLCLQVKDRDEARHWVELRHTGENGGAGIVPWSSDDVARFQSRTKGFDIHTQALNFLEKHGAITAEARREVPAASYRRLLGTPEVRAQIGIEWKDKKLKLLANKKDVAKALLYIANDLTKGTTKTQHIYTHEQRIQYANNLPSEIVVRPTKKSGNGIDAEGSQIEAGTKRATRNRRAKPRSRLIPSDCVLNVSDPRVREIEKELRYLSLEDFPNAISVLFRVFIELSVDTYIGDKKLSVGLEARLRQKLQQVLADLISRKSLTKEQASPVRRALQGDSFLAPSINMMNSYVHNANVFPAPGDLRASWNSLQPFIIAIWSP